MPFKYFTMHVFYCVATYNQENKNRVHCSTTKKIEKPRLKIPETSKPEKECNRQKINKRNAVTSYKHR